MFNHPVLDIAIGVVFVFLTYSLLASAINEIIAAMIAQRGRMLLRGIQKMLNGESIYWWHNLENFFRKKDNPAPRHRRFKGSLAEQFKKHTLFRRLAKDNRPSYLSDAKFSDILLDILHQRGKAAAAEKDIEALYEPRTFNSVKAGLINVLNELDAKQGHQDCKANDKNCYHRRRQELFEIFSVLLDQSNGDLLRLKKLVENWYNEMMDRVSGWYKKQTHQVLFGIGLSLAVLFNVDAIELINMLSKDKKARETLVTMADSYIKNHPKPDTVFTKTATGKLVMDSTRIDTSRSVLADSVIRKVYNDAKQQADSVNTLLGLGWQDRSVGTIFSAILTDWRKFFGIFITALAIALGGPFWFDVLNKLVNLRMSGKAPPDAAAAPTPAGNSSSQLDQKPKPGSVG